MDQTIIDQENLNPATRTALGSGSTNFPALPSILSADWRPPNQTEPANTQGGDLTLRLKIYGDSDMHNWQEYFIDTEDPSTNTISVMKYWDGKGATHYTLTPRSYWVLVPGTYTRVNSGDSFNKKYTETTGIQEKDSNQLALSLGITVGKLLDEKLTATFLHEVTTSATKSSETGYTVGGPAPGFVRVWMLWQLFDELAALGADGNIIENPQRRADVNWSQHKAGGGAYVQYSNVQFVFPTIFFVPAYRDFPI